LSRNLVTGITGFIGAYLAADLVTRGEEVWGLKRWRTDPAGLRRLGVLDSPLLHLIEGDIQDFASVTGLVEAARPDVVFHLAAQSYPKESWSAPWHTMDANVTGTINLFEALRAASLLPRVHIPGSAAQYGPTSPAENPITERQEFRPSSPYAVSKCTQELLARQYRTSYGFETVVTRSFIHTGPGQGDRCVLQTFCNQVALIESRKQEPVIKVGNLSPIRDFSDVRDTVRAFQDVMRKGVPGEAYNIGSGRGTKIDALLRLVLDASSSAIEVQVDPARLRRVDEPVMVADISKVSAATGWAPKVMLETTVSDVLDDWRARVRGQR
jgi:GDP-4-dehydro-6-deoxy-D-mannose reductase